MVNRVIKNVNKLLWPWVAKLPFGTINRAIKNINKLLWPWVAKLPFGTLNKAMRSWEIYAIQCYKEFRLTEI